MVHRDERDVNFRTIDVRASGEQYAGAERVREELERANRSRYGIHQEIAELREQVKELRNWRQAVVQLLPSYNQRIGSVESDVAILRAATSEVPTVYGTRSGRITTSALTPDEHTARVLGVTVSGLEDTKRLARKLGRTVRFDNTSVHPDGSVVLHVGD
jgi:chromosome segregation ATPase